jgi:hypothetical protein
MIFAFVCNILELESSIWQAIDKLLVVVGCCLLYSCGFLFVVLFLLQLFKLQPHLTACRRSKPAPRTDKKTPKNRVHAAQVTFCPPLNHQLETHFARDLLISITIRSSSSHQQIPCVRTHWHLIAEPLLSSSRCFRNIFGLLLLGCPER